MPRLGDLLDPVPSYDGGRRRRKAFAEGAGPPTSVTSPAEPPHQPRKSTSDMIISRRAARATGSTRASPKTSDRGLNSHGD